MRNMACFIVLLMVLSAPVLAGYSYVSRDQRALPPPAPMAPQGAYPMTFTDYQTTSSPMGNMDTMQTQSVGTYGDSHPRSHPIRLNRP